MFLQWLTWSNNCEPLNSVVCKYIGLGFKCLPKNNNKSINHRELRPFKKLSNCCMRKPFSQGETSFHIFKTDKARFYHSDFIVGFTVFEEQELNKTTGHHASERESSSLTCGKKIHLWLIWNHSVPGFFDILIGRSSCIEAKRYTSPPVTHNTALLPF